MKRKTHSPEERMLPRLSLIVFSTIVVPNATEPMMLVAKIIETSRPDVNILPSFLHVRGSGTRLFHSAGEESRGWPAVREQDIFTE